jgi:D-aminoacyl-tRNA deacylase
MIAVVERVHSAAVTVSGRETGRIGRGLLVLLGVEKGDRQEDLEYVVRKVAGLRIFDNGGKMDLSVTDVGGEILVVSQFTLSGDARKGKRPDFANAADPDTAFNMYKKCIEAFRALYIKTGEGEFGANMRVDSSGDGPVTILLNSRKLY